MNVYPYEFYLGGKKGLKLRDSYKNTDSKIIFLNSHSNIYAVALVKRSDVSIVDGIG